ncbi:hypothetical protein BGZ90_012508 [Linnemannia elongata]|nr:hypothetical protein BGZ90_012508 [Linnemannia elongata]
MQLVPNNPPNNPLDLPEIRTRVATFLKREDCLSCIRVSRDWFHDFVPSVWHTIDFKTDAAAFTAVTPEVLEKYGGFIAQTLDVEGPERLSALQHSRVDSIRTMDVCLPGSWVYRELLSDLMLRCSGSIKDLRIRSFPPDPDTFEEQRKWACHYMHVNDDLALFRVVIIRHKPAVTLYTGSNLRYLSASVAQVWCNDEEDPLAPCLLLHFPLLKAWDILLLDRPKHWTSKITKRIKIMTDLLLNSFEDLEACIFSAGNLDSSSALGLISHQETLISVTITNRIQDAEDATAMRWVHLIMKLCGNLETFSFEGMQCDVDKCVWGSRDLKELRVMFEGLEATQDIEGCVKQLCGLRQAGGIVGAQPMAKDTISTRVAKHLMQFKKLRTVWLGIKDYYLPPFSA